MRAFPFTFSSPGEATIERTSVDKNNVPETRTAIKLILGDPDAALSMSGLPVDGVGLVRQEFVVANHIGIHPMACLQPEKVSPEDREIINERSRNDKSPKDFFLRKLSEGIGSIAAAFYPRPVLVRLGDFKSNEYRRLVGGESFEPVEENPMIGLRGSSRYLSNEFRDGECLYRALLFFYDTYCLNYPLIVASTKAFKLECEALSYVRDEMGLKNVDIMVPFCRTAEEGKAVIQILNENGLRQGKDGLQVWVMCELPSNVLAIDEFAKVFDGFSIGSNDLTQLCLGVDRDSGLLAGLFDEDNTAVREAISLAIKGAHRNGKEVGLCGQAPSDKPEFARFLVDLGIDSISLTPDAVLKALDVVSAAESEHGLQDEIGKAIKGRNMKSEKETKEKDSALKA